jgi:translation elongation factor P/translation initiation factor 5A
MKMKPVQVEKQYEKTIPAKNTIQNICVLDSQILLMEKRGHSVYFVTKIL